MKHEKKIYLILFLTLTFANQALACTGIRLTSKDGSAIYARTSEFGLDLDSDVIVVPRNFRFTGSTSSGRPGIQWNSKFAVVGTNGGKETIIVDGVNEKGLAGGSFYFPGFAEFQNITKESEGESLAPFELLTWILTNFENADEVKKALPTIKVGNVKNKSMGIVPPIHLIIHDKNGSIVIEYTKSGLSIYDNPLGIITNSPTFDWHLTNLRNYINLSTFNIPSMELGGIKFQQLGQGTGMLGLPGDFTPPSRFIRATFFSKASIPLNSAQETILQAFHILNNFDIPKGMVREKGGNQKEFERTQWTSAIDLKNRRFYFRTFENSDVRMVDLTKFDLSSKEVKTLSMKESQKITELQ